MPESVYEKLVPGFIVLLLLLLPPAGCVRHSRAPGAENVKMALEVEPAPPVRGSATLLITLQDADGNPLEDARLNVKGDMSHAGMESVLAEGEGGPGGVYQVPFEWTMGGDWIVTVEAILGDGTTVSRRFDLSVAGDMDLGE